MFYYVIKQKPCIKASAFNLLTIENSLMRINSFIHGYSVPFLDFMYAIWFRFDQQ